MYIGEIENIFDQRLTLTGKTTKACGSLLNVNIKKIHYILNLCSDSNWDL